MEQLVWAKYSVFPWWPGQVELLNNERTSSTVEFFGEETRERVPNRQIKPYAALREKYYKAGIKRCRTPKLMLNFKMAVGEADGILASSGANLDTEVTGRVSNRQILSGPKKSKPNGTTSLGDTMPPPSSGRNNKRKKGERNKTKPKVLTASGELGEITNVISDSSQLSSTAISNALSDVSASSTSAVKRRRRSSSTKQSPNKSEQCEMSSLPVASSAMVGGILDAATCSSSVTKTKRRGRPPSSLSRVDKSKSSGVVSKKRLSVRCCRVTDDTFDRSLPSTTLSTSNANSDTKPKKRGRPSLSTVAISNSSASSAATSKRGNMARSTSTPSTSQGNIAKKTRSLSSLTGNSGTTSSCGPTSSTSPFTASSLVKPVRSADTDTLPLTTGITPAKSNRNFSKILSIEKPKSSPSSHEIGCLSLAAVTGEPSTNTIKSGKTVSRKLKTSSLDLSAKQTKSAAARKQSPKRKAVCLSSDPVKSCSATVRSDAPESRESAFATPIVDVGGNADTVKSSHSTLGEPSSPVAKSSQLSRLKVESGKDDEGSDDELPSYEHILKGPPFNPVPGEIVWIKLRMYPQWPGLIIKMNIRKKKVAIKYINSDNLSRGLWIRLGCISAYPGDHYAEYCAESVANPLHSTAVSKAIRMTDNYLYRRAEKEALEPFTFFFPEEKSLSNVDSESESDMVDSELLEIDASSIEVKDYTVIRRKFSYSKETKDRIAKREVWLQKIMDVIKQEKLTSFITKCIAEERDSMRRITDTRLFLGPFVCSTGHLGDQLMKLIMSLYQSVTKSSHLPEWCFTSLIPMVIIKSIEKVDNISKTAAEQKFFEDLRTSEEDERFHEQIIHSASLIPVEERKQHEEQVAYEATLLKL